MSGLDYPLGTIKPKRERRRKTRAARTAEQYPPTLVAAEEREAYRAAVEASTPVTGDVLTTCQAARLLQVSESTVHRLVHVEGLPCRRIGKGFRFHRAAVLKWLESDTP